MIGLNAAVAEEPVAERRRADDCKRREHKRRTSERPAGKFVGLLPHADYIMLPVPPGEEIDRDNASHDQTPQNDGWAVFSGTSAAAPQLAGVCALLLEKNSNLKPADIKAILRRTAREITAGHANPVSDPNGAGETAAAGATGTGLVDAYAAWQQA